MTNPSPLNVSRETQERLEAFSALVTKWTPRINLISKSSITQIWDRHIVDSIQVFHTAPVGEHWVDLGSGGGFPGIVCAILALEHAPHTQFTIVESDQRKSTFLRTAIRETGVNCQVLTQRIEQAPPLKADILSARALADLTTLMEFCDRHLLPNGTAVFSKGERWKKEVDNARSQWNFTVEPITSLTESKAVLLKISGVLRV
ncbi:MAG: 16S rRNA (guanine(527)-N(7))-methyltransferase RsmG [Pseudomonadota bacterium]